jgi:hypothetical protein
MQDQPFPGTQVVLAVAAVVVLVFASPGVRASQLQSAGAPASVPTWDERVAAAAWIANIRPDTVSYAVVDAAGRQVAGFRADNPVPAASTVKALILAAYLRQPEVADRDLTATETTRLHNMITWSSNDDATRLLLEAGWPAVEATAAAAGMGEAFVPDYALWGLTEVTAASLAQLFHRLPALLPQRHREFALGLFAEVIPWHQWGMPRAAPVGWEWHVKGGWISSVVNQVGTFTRDSQEFTVAVTVEGESGVGDQVSADPESVPAVATIEEVTRALFAGGAMPESSSSDCPSAHGQQVAVGWTTHDRGCGAAVASG